MFNTLTGLTDANVVGRRVSGKKTTGRGFIFHGFRRGFYARF